MRDTSTCTDLGNVDTQSLNVGSGKVLNGNLIVHGAADNVDDEATALEVECEGAGKGQRRRAGNDNHVLTAAIASSSGAAGAAIEAVAAHSAVTGVRDSGDEQAGEDFVADNPALGAFECRGRGDGKNGSRRGGSLWAQMVRQPGGAGQRLSDLAGSLVYCAINILGSIA